MALEKVRENLLNAVRIHVGFHRRESVGFELNSGLTSQALQGLNRGLHKLEKECQS